MKQHQINLKPILWLLLAGILVSGIYQPEKGFIDSVSGYPEDKIILQIEELYLEPVQLTDNNLGDMNAQIHNGMVTWEGYVGNNYEIFLFDGTSISQLTDNDFDDRDPQIHDGMVTWSGSDGNDREIFLYDGTSISQLTDNDINDDNPQIHNGLVTWHGGPFYNEEIFIFNGISIRQVTDNDVNDWYPQIHDGWVTWAGFDGNDREIFLQSVYNVSLMLQLTYNDVTDYFPQIHDGMVTWQSRVGDDDFEIFLFDGTSIRQLTDNDVVDTIPQIHDGMVTWHSGPHFNEEIFLFDGTSIRQVTDNDVSDTNPQIHDGMVTWEGYIGNNYEIFLFDGTSIRQLTHNDVNDRTPQIHDGLVTWRCYDGNDYEIFITGPDTTPPMIDHPEDVKYEEGTTDHNIIWNPFDHNPDSYSIARDGIIVESGTWRGADISINIDGLQPGSYIYECTVYDGPGHTSSDTVLVSVWPHPVSLYWVTAPTDQYQPYNRPLDYHLTVATSSSIFSWWINDTVNFELSATYYQGGSTVRLTNKTTLAPGDHGLWIIVEDIEGNSLSAIFRIIVVPPSQQLQLKLSGSFDYLEKEKIHIQLAGLLTEKFTGEPVSGASISFTIYNPDGLAIYEDYFLENTDSSGVYVFKHPLTIDEDKDVLLKGIYCVYAYATNGDGLEAVDMILFHIDPPSDESSNILLDIAPIGLSIVTIMGLIIGGFYIWMQKFRIS